MTQLAKRSITFLLLALLINASSVWAVIPKITLVGKGVVSGSSSDKSRLTGNICQASAPTNCVSASIFGGFGSDIAYTGHDNVFISAPDRGPFDGLTDVAYLDRFHFLHLTTDVGAEFPNIRTLLLDTRFLKNENGQIFTGAANDFENRFDPEGIRVGVNGTFYVSDEYGPFVMEFDRQGNLIRRLTVPAKFLISYQSSNPTEELLDNTSGRQANRGMEGLAISPDGSTLFGIMQNALLQDNALNPGTTDRISRNTRILKLDLVTGETHEYIYQLEAFNRGQGVSEILAINDSEFLVVERDNRSFLSGTPQAPTRKKINKIDISDATDVSNLEGLPAVGLPVGVVAASKSTFIDLLDPALGLNLNNTNAIAEKIEGLAWGPDLDDGRHILYVMSDNDLNPSFATQIYSFAIERSLVNYQAQTLPGPLFPPGQVKKALR